ncbi:MAG: hypothetical protein GY859_11680 [Desulfobacterales bacterium]|nr:hypothetical protein [Desulfobacterales bacterium]
MKSLIVKRMLTRSPWMVAAFFFLAGCVSSPGEESAPSGASPNPAPRSISELYENPGAFDGRVVELSGRFMGWTGCRAPTRMGSRSDWTLQDDQTCIYVSGGFPPGLRPRDKKDKGRHVTIKALVVHDNQRVYLRLVNEKP